MMRTAWRCVLAVAIVVAVSAGGAAGQIGPVRTGYAVDASNRIGSGGYNYIADGAGGVNSQLYVYGQVSGLGRFRGHVGYVAPNQLSLTLPSAGLDRFRAESVGLQQVLSGQTYRVTPYYNRSTILRPADVRAGLAAPGTNIPLSPTRPLPVVSQRLYMEAAAGYRPIIPSSWRPGLAVGARAVPTDLGAGVPLSSIPGALFGSLSAEDRLRLSRQLYEMAEERNGRQDDHRVRRGEVGSEVDTPAPAEPGDREAMPEAERTDEPSPGRRTPEGILPEPNMDVYVDLLLKMREQQADAQQRETVEPPDPTEPLDPSAALPATIVEEAGLSEAEQARIATMLVDLAEDRSVVIHGLAGLSKDAFNKHLAAGEKQLKDGKYYTAVEQFQLAVIADRSNPIARTGLSLAFFGAGEPYSAAVHLRRALELFPPMMETRLDIARMMDGKVFAARLAELDRQLDRDGVTPSASMCLLASYMHANVGDITESQAYAAKLAKVAGEDKLFSAYATYQLTGRRPAESRE